MTKRQTIDGIIARNPTAKPEFLAGFSDDDLTDYLRQLESVESRPRDEFIDPATADGQTRQDKHPDASLGG